MIFKLAPHAHDVAPQCRNGAIAQLGERLHGMQEVGGSIPPGSTTLRLRLRVAQPRKTKAKRAQQSPKGDDGPSPILLDLLCATRAGHRPAR